MKVQDFVVEASKRLAVVTPDVDVRRVAEELAQPGIDLVVVVGADGQMQGVVTDSDIVVWVAESQPEDGNATADMLMSKTVFSCTVHQILGSVVAEAVGRKLKHLPVVSDNGEPIGVIYVSDALIALHKEDQLSTESLLEFVHGAGYRQVQVANPGSKRLGFPDDRLKNQPRQCFLSRRQAIRSVANLHRVELDIKLQSVMARIESKDPAARLVITKTEQKEDFRS